MDAGPYTLAIETSNPSSAEAGMSGAGIAIGVLRECSTQVLGAEPVGPDDDLVSAIDRLTRRLGLGPRHLGAVAVSIGPGGYTGLRTAVAAAKMLCEATAASCIPVPTALVAAHHFMQRPDAGAREQRFGVALASKGDSVFLTVFDSGRPAGPGGLADAGDLSALGLAVLLADRFLPDPLRARAASLGIRVRPLVLSAGTCLEVSAACAPLDPLALAPLYPRQAEAVTQWQKRRP